MSHHVALAVLVNQSGLRVTDPHTSASEVLGLKVGPTTLSFFPPFVFLLKTVGIYTVLYIHCSPGWSRIQSVALVGFTVQQSSCLGFPSAGVEGMSCPEKPQQR